MEHLFEFDSNKNIIPTPTILIYPLFKKLWDRDKSKGKKKAISELGYIWYMCSQSPKKNPYYEKFINNDKGRSAEIILDLFETKYKPDKLVKDCIVLFTKNIYKESVDTRETLIITRTKIKNWLKNYDPDKDEDGLQVQRNTKTINELNKTIKEYTILIEQEEESSNNKITGGGELGAFEE